MKVLFANFPWWQREEGKPLRKGVRAGSRWPHTNEATHEPDKWRWGGYAPFPFFMGYAASYLAEKLPHCEVVVRDSIARGESYESFFAFLEEWHPAFVVIESATPSWEHDADMIERMRGMLTHTKFIVAGPITMADQLFEDIWATIRGEYEKGVVKAVRGQSGMIEHDFLTQDEMNEAPAPAFDDEVADRYWDANPKGNTRTLLQVWGSRGCFAKCCFCSWPAVMTGNDPDGSHARLVRFYRPDAIRRFIEGRIQMGKAAGNPIRSVYFDDDSGNLTDRHTLDVCSVMKEISLPWSMMCRADTIKRETWAAMKESGCFGVKIGIESGSQRVLDEIVNKRLNLKSAIETCRFIRSLGMTVHSTWTIGLPAERPEERAATIALIEEGYKTGVHDTHQLSAVAELDGTPLANMVEGKAFAAFPGAIKDENYNRSIDGAKEIEKITR